MLSDSQNVKNYLNYTVDGMDNSLRPDVSAVRCTASSVSQQQFQAVLSIYHERFD